MVDFTTTAFIYPGQGSQTVGMCQDIANAYPVANETLEEANDILGFDLRKLMFEGSADELNDTAITQPAIYVCSIAMLRALRSEMPQAKPTATAGHSLGELTALTAAGSLSFADGVKLTQVRGRLMKAAGEQHPGGMAAVLGISPEDAQRLVDDAAAKTGTALVIANDNCPGQIVISGDQTALDEAVAMAKDYGAKRAIPLAVSVATHSPLMAPARKDFWDYIHTISFDEPHIPIYGNVSAAPLHSVEDIYNELEDQLTSTVQWTKSMNGMIAAGIDTFVEIGPKDVLTGLLKRIDRTKNGVNIQDLPSLMAFLQKNA